LRRTASSSGRNGEAGLLRGKFCVHPAKKLYMQAHS